MKVSIRPSRVTLMIGSASAALMLGFASTAHAQASGDAASTQASDTATDDAGGDIVVRGFRASVFESIAAKRESPIIRSEEHTSELQSLMRISYAVFCLKKKKQ